MSFTTFLKIIAGLFGSLLLAAGVSGIVFYFIGNNVADNIENVDDTVRSVAPGFIAENKDQLRKELETFYQDFQFPKKEELQIACNNPKALTEDYQKILTEEFCSNIDSMSEEEKDSKIWDHIINSNMDKILESTSSEDTLKPIREIDATYGTYLRKPYMVFMGLVLYILGAVLLLFSSGFNFIDGLYKIVSKTSFDLVTVSAFLLAIRLVSVNMLLTFFNWVRELFAVPVKDVPMVLIKFTLVVTVEWIRLSTNPVLIWTALASVPFIGAIKRLAHNKEAMFIQKIDTSILHDAEKSYKIRKDLKDRIM